MVDVQTATFIGMAVLAVISAGLGFWSDSQSTKSSVKAADPENNQALDSNTPLTGNPYQDAAVPLNGGKKSKKSKKSKRSKGSKKSRRKH